MSRMYLSYLAIHTWQMGGMVLLIWLARIGSGDMLTPVAADMDADVGPVPPTPLPLPPLMPANVLS